MSNTMRAQGNQSQGSMATNTVTNGPSEVDWAYIEQQLHGIPDDFKSQKFNSLKRVMEILSSSNPNLALNEVRFIFFQDRQGSNNYHVDYYYYYWSAVRNRRTVEDKCRCQ